MANLEKVFHRGDHFFDGLIKECKRARHEILIEAYIFETDILGRKLLKVLKKKAKEGVQIKVLIDGIGSYSFCPLLFKKLRHPNFAIRFFNPLPFQLPHNDGHTIKTFFSGLIKGLFGINNRNHRKTYIIDRRVAFIGSINITRLHSMRLSGERSWRDSGVRIKDDRIQLLHAAFERSWNLHLEPRRRPGALKELITITKNGLRLNDCPLSRFLQNKDLLKRVNEAQRRVWITNPYFVPSSHLMNALIHAARRGVDVCIIVPRKSDMKLFPLINSLSSRQLAAHAVKIFEYRPRILHAKVMIIDNWCILGSSNLNSRSLKHDLEVDVVLREEQAKSSLIRQFLCDLADSVRVEKRDILMRYGEKVHHSLLINLIRYWL